MFHFWLNTFFVDTEHRCFESIRIEEKSQEPTAATIAQEKPQESQKPQEKSQEKSVASNNAHKQSKDATRKDHSATHAHHLADSASKKLVSDGVTSKTGTASSLECQKPPTALCKDHSKGDQQAAKAFQSQFSCVECYREGLQGDSEAPYCYKTVELGKFEIDKAHKDKQHRIYNKEFTVSSIFCCLPCNCSLF